MRATLSYSILMDSKQQDRRAAQNKKYFEIAVKSINKNPQLFTDYCQKRILDKLNDIECKNNIKVKAIFEKEAGKEFLALLNKPLSPEIEVKPRTNHEKLMDIFEKNFPIDSAINQQDKNGFTRLSWAANVGDIDVVKQLLADKADPNISDNYKSTPLIRAGYGNHFAVIKVLLENIVNHPEFDINSQLAKNHFAYTIRINDLDSFNLFIEKGIFVNKDGILPSIDPQDFLYSAVSVNNLDMIQTLIQHGAALETKEPIAPFNREKSEPWTAYDRAVFEKSIPAIKLLLEPILADEKYASKNIINPQGFLHDLLSDRLRSEPGNNSDIADKYLLLKLFQTHQLKRKTLNDPKLPCLSDEEFVKLKTAIDEINIVQVKRCVEIDELQILPKVLVEMVGDYGHPHVHAKRLGR